LIPPDFRQARRVRIAKRPEGIHGTQSVAKMTRAIERTNRPS
jgi:hypothetical protein